MDEIVGVGPTDELNLRVSAATLARVLFPNPDDGRLMLALERKATWVEKDRETHFIHRVQPFGGAVRINDTNKLREIIGEFHFDSLKSRDEHDFRILINPDGWSSLREFTIEAFRVRDSPHIESDPTRELVEEFNDTIGLALKSSQYELRAGGIVLENEPRPTRNVHASGNLTVRVYKIYEAGIMDPSLSRAIIKNSLGHSEERLQRQAEENAREKGRGWANAILAAPLDEVQAAYAGTPPERRKDPVPFAGTYLDGNVSAVLEDVEVPSYQRIF
ncbi:MAG: hypothetical protein R3335_05110 [Anaerolineales bacterium]|nr:hypothetical protein [Anaerolineales bacterium]